MSNAGNHRVKTLARAAVLLMVGLAAVAGPRIAFAQLSSQGGDTSGSSCTGGCNADGCCSFSRANSGAVTGTSFTSRYAWNINADVTPGATRDTSSSAQ